MEGDIFLHTNMMWNYVMGMSYTKFQNPFYNVLHRLYSYMWMTSGLLLALSLFYELGSLTHAEAQVITENLRITFLITFSLVKFLRTRSAVSRKIVAHIRVKEREFVEHEDPNVRRIFEDARSFNRFMCNFFQCFGYFTLLLFEIHPYLYEKINKMDVKFDIVDNITVYRPRPLPFGGDFPFDKYKYYKSTYGFYVWTGLFCCGATITPDIFYYALMIFGTAEIRILQYRLRNFKKLALRKEYDLDESNALQDVDDVAKNRKIAAYLRDCIIEHKLIIQYVDDMDQCIKYLMLIDSCLTSVQIAVIGFGIIVLGFGITQIVGIEYLLWTISQLFFFYWFANELSLAGYGLQDAIWESKWYECNNSIKKTLILVLMRTSKPLALYVGPFYAMSVDTMLSILKTAVSYFALMRQMYE